MRRLIPLLIAFLVLTPPAEAAWVWPVSGEVITPYRNGTDPYANGQHRGIDIAAPVGTPVVAAAGGAVRFAGTAGSSGLTISIRTGDGYDTSYLHLSSLAARAGAQVSAGERIGAVGTTGTRSAAAPHLHFGVRDAGTRHDYHDPLAFLPPPPPPAHAPEPPPPAPAPAPQPAPPAPAPATIPRAAPVPNAVPRSRPHAPPHARPQAAPRPHPVVHRIPRPVPHGSPRQVPRAAPLRSPHAPRGLPAAPQTSEYGIARDARSMPTRSPQVSDTPGGSVPRGLSTPSRSGTASEGAGGGPDIAWIAACMGLLLAGGILGLTGDRGTRTSSRIRALLRPLAVRR